jgi:hypothetical protein
MIETLLSLPVVDGLTLSKELRAALRPGETLKDEGGRTRRLPRWFYEVSSWEEAENVQLAPKFYLYELIRTDVREAEALYAFPRYVPCAVTLLAAGLSVLRQHFETYVYVAGNGGYRSPSHHLTRAASTHCWGTAANIYRVGDDYLETQDVIERYAEQAREVLPGAWIRSYGSDIGFADDHLHIDFGYARLVPHDADSDDPDSDA